MRKSFKYEFILCIHGVYFMDDNEFLKLLNESDDCPEKLIKMAKTPFQKQAAVEFVLVYKRIDSHGHDIKMIKRITYGIFTLTAIACVVQVINSIILPIL